MKVSLEVEKTIFLKLWKLWRCGAPSIPFMQICQSCLLESCVSFGQSPRAWPTIRREVNKCVRTYHAAAKVRSRCRVSIKLPASYLSCHYHPHTWHWTHSCGTAPTRSTSASAFLAASQVWQGENGVSSGNSDGWQFASYDEREKHERVTTFTRRAAGSDCQPLWFDHRESTTCELDFPPTRYRDATTHPRALRPVAGKPRMHRDGRAFTRTTECARSDGERAQRERERERERSPFRRWISRGLDSLE